MYLLAQLKPGWPPVDLRVYLCGVYSLRCSIFFINIPVVLWVQDKDRAG